MPTTPTSPLTTGVHHLGLTVHPLADAVAFFTQTLGFQQVAERPEYPAVFVSDGQILLTLWQAQEESHRPFDRKKQIGLHHVALKLRDKQALNDLQEALKKHPGVTVEFGLEPLGQSGLQHLMASVPGGLRVEWVIASDANE